MRWRREDGGRRGGHAPPPLPRNHGPSSRRRCAACSTSRRRPSAARSRGKPLAGKTVALIFEKPSHPHPRQLRGRHPPAGRRCGACSTSRDMQLGARRDAGGHRARAVALRGLRSCCAPRRAKHPRAGGLRDGAGDQRPDRHLPSLPDHGRRADLRGASRRRSPARSSPGPATATTWRRASSRPPRASASPCGIATPPDLAPAAPSSSTGRAPQGARIELTDGPGRGGARRPLRRHRHLGLDVGREAGWRHAQPAQPAGALSGERRRCCATPRRTPSSCTACRRIAARRSPTR